MLSLSTVGTTQRISINSIVDQNRTMNESFQGAYFIEFVSFIKDDVGTCDDFEKTKRTNVCRYRHFKRIQPPESP